MGHGPRHLLAFHGFGQDAAVLAPLAEKLSPAYTIHSFSLFWHGRSVPPAAYQPGDQALPAGFYPEMIAAYIRDKGINEFALLGNSMGGRIALLLVQRFASQVSHLFLLAPDGVKKSFWYHFATHNLFGRRIFRYSLYHPRFFFRLVRIARLLRFASVKMEKFAISQFSAEENRKKVFRVWNLHADAEPNLAETKAQLLKYGITGCIFTGKRDPVLNRTIGERFVKGLGDAFVHIPLDTGHELLKTHLVPVIAQTIMECTEKRKPSPQIAEEGNMD